MSKRRLLGTIFLLALGVTSAPGQNIYPPVIPQNSTNILPLNNTFTGNNSHTGKETFLGITWTGYATPEMYGATIASSDNSAALQSAFASGNQIWLGGTYKSASPITVTACPSITGKDPSTSGILFTGSGDGLTINCSQSILFPQSGKVNLQSFGIYTSYAGAGTPLKLNFAAQAPANVVINTLDMRNVHVSGQNLATEWWTSPVTCINCYGSNIYYNWISGKSGSVGSWWDAMSAGLYFTNSAASVPSMVNNIIGNSIYGVGKAVYATSAGGIPALEGFIIRGNTLVTNDYAVYVDESANSYYAPGWTVNSNATNSAIASFYFKHVAQVFIDDNYAYTDTTTGDGIVLNDVINTAIGMKNQIIGVSGLSSGYGVRSIASGAGIMQGGFFQNFAVGVSLDAASSQWMVKPFNYNTVTTLTTNAGSANLIEQYNTTTGLYSLLSNLSTYGVTSSGWYSSTSNNNAALPPASSLNSFSLGWNYGSAAEMDLFNTFTGGGNGFELWQMTSPSATQLLFSILPAGTGGVVQLVPIPIASLPACSAAASVGKIAVVNNGVTSPTYHQTVDSTGTGQWPVTCTYNGSTYQWSY